MSAASCLTAFVLAALPAAGSPAPVEARKTIVEADQLRYLVKLHIFRGETPGDQTRAGNAVAEPSLLVVAGRPASLHAGGEESITRPDGARERDEFGTAADVTVVGTHRNLVRVALALRHRERRADGTLPEWATARFEGPIPLDETFRFSGDGVWASVEVEYVGPSLKAWEERFPEPISYEIPVRLYEGTLPENGPDDGRLLGRPVIRTLAGSPAVLTSGQEGPARRADGAPVSTGRYQRLDVTATPAGPDAAHVVATLRVASFVEESSEESSRRRSFYEHPTGEPDARFVGVVRLGEPFRLGGDGAWAELTVKRLDACE